MSVELISAAIAKGWIKPAPVVPAEMVPPRIYRPKTFQTRNNVKITRVRRIMISLPERFTLRQVAQSINCDINDVRSTLAHMVRSGQILVIRKGRDRGKHALYGKVKKSNKNAGQCEQPTNN